MAGETARRAATLDPATVWRAVEKASFAVLAHVTPAGDPRSSGIVYRSHGHRLYVAVAADSWKARHIARNPHVAMTVTVRRGGILTLMAPIPPAVVSFHGTAVVHESGSETVRRELGAMARLLPDGSDSTHGAAVLEITPRGGFLTYGIGVPLTAMRDPARALGRAPTE